MKNFERITLVTTAAAATTAATAYLIQKIIHNRADRALRIAAGESRYERKHAKIHQLKHA